MSSDTVTDETMTEATDELASALASSDEPDNDELPCTDAEDQADDAEADENPNAEAKRWRHKLRDEQAAHKETQAVLDELSQRVEALQRQHIESMLAAANVKPAALWAVTELGTLVGEDGTVDADAVTAAIGNARKELGIQPLGKGAYVPQVGHRPDGLPKTDAFVDAFKPKRK